jgi:FixJ family two-component response regulator
MSAAATILVVEDDSGIVDIADFALSRNGWKLVPKVSGEDALVYLQTRRVDAIVCDVKLPGMSGVDFHARLAGQKQMTHPFVFITGYSMDWESIKHGTATEHPPKLFYKPFSFDDVARHIEGVLEAKSQGKLRELRA